MSFTPYQFQIEDVEKIERQKAGAIGSEMGTGKTHEAIALDEVWWKRGAPPTLIVAPLNTFDSWLEKYSMQSPKSDLIVIDRKNRDKFTDEIRRRRGDVFIMHHEAMRLMPELAGFTFNVIVADEAHREANYKAQQTRALKKLHANYKLAMSGTLSGDQPQNLWSILNWLWPKYYTSYWRFFKHYVIQEHVDDPSGKTHGYRKVVGVQNVAQLKKEMEPFFVRHLKKERCCENHPDGVMWWLPDKVYDSIWVDLTPTQKRVYEEMRKTMVAWINNHEDTPLVAGQAITQLTRLSQMAIATPEIVGTKWVRNSKGERVEVDDVRLTAPSSKIDAVKEKILDASYDSSGKPKQFLVYSSSKQAVYLAAGIFERAGITTSTFTGDTPQAERTGMVKRFVEGDFQVFLATIPAISEGTDGLQYATDTAIFLDRSWSTIKNKQAEDRLHRGGTKDTVQIIDVMARGTLDWGRHQKLEMKWSWIKQILGDIPYTQHLMQEEK
jgi:SNF2 family DNA or RNA helicase